jgi:alpha-glucosidase
MKIVKTIQDMTPTDKKLFYMCNARPILKQSALFSDTTCQYRIPAEPKIGDVVKLRLRTGRYNVDRAYLYANHEEHLMKRYTHDTLFDYYEAEILVVERIDYYFKVEAGRTICYYNQAGTFSEPHEEFDFFIMPGYQTPQWAKGAVMYQIFVDRFCDGNAQNNVINDEYSYLEEHVTAQKDWFAPPKKRDIGNFYGGDLQGVASKLDYLADLGVEVIYFNPLFVSPSNHKYDIQDYDYIDPHFGVIQKEQGNLLSEGDQDNRHATKYIDRVTNIANLEASNAYFAKLVEEIHRRGMRVIIDGVFNHCGSFNKWMDRDHIYSSSTEEYKLGAYESAKSPYRDFFKFSKDAWPDNQTYDGWWGHETLPKLNYEESEQLEKYILDIAKKWVSPPFKVDGWRLDVAADLGYSSEYNHEFWKKFRKVVKEANEDAIIIAEHYGDSRDWLLGDEWDTVMNYDAFMEPVTWFLTGMEKHSDAYRQDLFGNGDAFFASMQNNMARMGGLSCQISMNELSNHDHSRFLTRTNKTVGRIETLGTQAAETGINKAVFMEAVVMQMTWPGAPTIYYGDEAGVCGWTDPDNRRTYPWGQEDQDLLNFTKAAIKVHKENKALREGSVKKLLSEHNLIAYGRFQGEDAYVIIINNSEDDVRTKIPVWEIGITYKDEMEQILSSYENGYSTQSLLYSVKDGLLNIGLRKTSAVVLRRIKW